MEEDRSKDRFRPVSNPSNIEQGRQFPWTSNSSAAFCFNITYPQSFPNLPKILSYTYILLLIPSLEKKKKFIYFLPRSKLKLRPTFDFFPNPASFHLHPPSKKNRQFKPTNYPHIFKPSQIFSNPLKPPQTSSN